MLKVWAIKPLLNIRCKTKKAMLQKLKHDSFLIYQKLRFYFKLKVFAEVK